MLVGVSVRNTVEGPHSRRTLCSSSYPSIGKVAVSTHSVHSGSVGGDVLVLWLNELPNLHTVHQRQCQLDKQTFLKVVL